MTKERWIESWIDEKFMPIAVYFDLNIMVQRPELGVRRHESES